MPSGTLQYNTLDYDTLKIVVFKRDTIAIEEFPQNSDPLPLTQEDLEKVDSLLISAVEEYNEFKGKPFLKSFMESGYQPLDSGDFIIYLRNYRCQYLPYKDVNGQRIVYVCCFRNQYANWKREAYRGRLHGGTIYFYIKMNLSEDNSDGVYTTGYG